MLTRVESDSRRIIGLAQAGVASEMEKVQAEVDNGVKKVDDIIANKEKDLMQV